MKKIILLVILSVTFFHQALSQGQGKGSLGVELGIPTGSGTEGVGTGIGGSLRYEKAINNNLNWTASFGYLSFPLSQNIFGINISGSASFIPIALGLKYYPAQSFNGFYFGANAGVTVINVKVSVPGFGSSSASENKFAFAPEMGYHFKGFDLTFRYNIISDSNYLGIRAAATF